jgi:hypothetical protein
VAFYRLLVRRHGGATGFLLGVHSLYRCLRDGYPYFGLLATLILLVESCLFEHPHPSSAAYCEPLPANHRQHGKKEDHWERAERSCQSERLPEGYTSRHKEMRSHSTLPLLYDPDDLGV